MESSISKISIDIKCKKCKDFYGTPQQLGFCSVCYQNHLKQQKHRTELARERENAVDVVRQSPKQAGFSKFEDKIKQQGAKKNVLKNKLKDLLKPNTKESSAPEQHLLDPDTLAELDKIHSELPAPLLANPALETDVRDVIRDVIVRLTHATEQEKAVCVEDLSEMMQNFYINFAKRMEMHKIYEDTTSTERELLLDYVEKYAMICLYPSLFCPPFTEDEEEDLAIQERIRQLQWVSAKHLDCGIEETNTTVLNLVYNSMGKLLEMDSARAPQDKLSRVVDCCRDIFLVLQGGPASADEFLPALIFLVLKTNLVRLKSNIHYVTRFCNADQLKQGEAGYFFTNLSCAVSFIENLTARDLGMDPVEFEEYMSGKRACSSFWESAMFVIESLHTMDEGLTTLSDLAAKQSEVLDGTVQMRSDLDSFCAEITASIERIGDEIPLHFNSGGEKVEFDGHLSGEGEWLVSPLQPQVIGFADLSSFTDKTQQNERDNESEGDSDMSLSNALVPGIHSAETSSLQSLDLNNSTLPLQPDESSTTLQPDNPSTTLQPDNSSIIQPLQPDGSTTLQPNSSIIQSLQPDACTTLQPDLMDISTTQRTQDPSSRPSEDISQPIVSSSTDSTQLPVQNAKRGSSGPGETQGTAQHSAPPTPQFGQTSYQGFSRQLPQIPSIPCAMDSSSDDESTVST
uniref:Rab5 GDP/GTP exchange factor n=1 Tax=Cacopsylla melanoneura TaxID=428564 RepID=A0A8D8WJP8_9HEMI